MVPPDHARRSCSDCGSELVYRADLQPDMLVVYSSFCLGCQTDGSSAAPPVLDTNADDPFALYWPGRSPGPAEAERGLWDDRDWDPIVVWGRPTAAPIAQLEPVPALAAAPIFAPAPAVSAPVVALAPMFAPAPSAKRTTAPAPVRSVPRPDAEATPQGDIFLWGALDPATRANGAGADLPFGVTESFVFAMPPAGWTPRRRLPLAALRARKSA